MRVREFRTIYDRLGWFGHAWCRIVHGHIMRLVGVSTGNKAMYMCARCLQTEYLHYIDSGRANGK